MIPLLLALALLLQATPTAHYRHHGSAWLPDSLVTPGAVVTTDTAIICRRGYATRIRAADSLAIRRIRASIYRAYGVKAGTIQLDHLIPVELGGASVRANLWPQPLAGTYAAHAKDIMENRMRREVCSGKRPLADAQRAIAADWRALAMTVARGWAAR